MVVVQQHFEGIGVTTSSLRYRVPGRIGSE